MRSESLLSSRARQLPSSFIRDVLSVTARPEVISLAGGVPDESLIAVDVMATAATSVLSSVGPAALQYATTEGVAALREVVARRCGAAPHEVLITTGSQQGVDLLARSLLDPGDVVVVESPSYLGSIQAFRSVGADVRAVRGDAAGLDTTALEALLASGVRPKAVSVVSEFANPTGATLSAPRRLHLVDLAQRFGFVIIDDNPYGELRWSGARPASIRDVAAAVGAEHLVVSLGSASKILAPGLRVGWMVASEEIRLAAVRFKQSADLHTSTLDQLIVAQVLADEPFMTAHLSRATALYRSRCGLLCNELEREFAGRLTFERPDGGMFLWASSEDESFDAMSWFHASIDAGVAFVPGAAFSVDDSWNGAVRLCFATVPNERLVEAVRRMTASFNASWRARSPQGA